jgi:hypothetical protein
MDGSSDEFFSDSSMMTSSNCWPETLKSNCKGFPDDCLLFDFCSMLAFGELDSPPELRAICGMDALLLDSGLLSLDLSSERATVVRFLSDVGALSLFDVLCKAWL